jgi:hypothetical protein
MRGARLLVVGALALLGLLRCSDLGWGAIEVTLQNLQASGDFALRVKLSQSAGEETMSIPASRVDGARFSIEGVVARATDLAVEVLVKGQVAQSGEVLGVEVPADDVARVTVALDASPQGCTAETPFLAGDGCCPPGATSADDPDCCVPGTLETSPLVSPGNRAAIAAGKAGEVMVAYLHNKRVHWAEPPSDSGVVDATTQVAGDPVAALLPDGTGVIAYLDADAAELRVATGRGNAWTDEVVDPDVSYITSGISLDIGVDLDGFVHLSYLVGSWPRTPRHTTNRTGAWKAQDLALKSAPAGDKLAMAVAEHPHFCHIPEGDRWVEYAVLKPSGLEATVVKTGLSYDLLACVIAVDPATETPHLFYSIHSTYNFTHATPEDGSWRHVTSTKLTQPVAARIQGATLHLAGTRHPTGYWHIWRPLAGVDWGEVKLLNTVNLPLAFDVDWSGQAHAVYASTSPGEGDLHYVTHCPAR